MATLSPAQQQQQHNRDSEGRYTHGALLTGMPDSINYPPPSDGVGDPPLFELPLDPHAYHLPPDAIEWDNLPEAQLATEETINDTATFEGVDVARDQLRQLWRKHYDHFTAARVDGDIVTAALHAEHMRHIEKLATQLDGPVEA